MLGNSQDGIGRYIGSLMLITSIWDGAEMWKALTTLDGKCSMKYCSVYTYERCLFPFSLWKMLQETTQLVGPIVLGQVTPKCCAWCSEPSEELWLGWREQKESAIE